MVKHFLVAWLLYWLAVWLLPVSSVYPGVGPALLLQVAFVLLVLAGHGALTAAFPTSPMPVAGHHDLAASWTLARIALWMSAIGFAAQAYDKLVIQGIDFSDGIALAREEWRELGEEREGQASSPFSALGYLLGSAYYVATVLALTQTRALTAVQRVGALSGSFLLVMANSAISGGRSNILLLAVVAVGALAARTGLRLRDLVPGRWSRRALGAALALALIWLLFVFQQRADAGDNDALEYALDFLPFLGVAASPWYEQSLDGGYLSQLSALLVLAVSYITHSFATVAAIIEAGPEDKTVVFLHVITLLSKLGVVAPPDGDWFLAGRMPSLPGALWHQFGMGGFAAGSLLLGAACAAVRQWTLQQPQALLPLGVFSLAGATLMLSPMLFAADFLSFPFVVGSLVQLALIDRWLRAGRLRAGAVPTRSYEPAGPRRSG